MLDFVILAELILIGIEVRTLFLIEASPFTVDKLKKSSAPMGKTVAKKVLSVK